MEHVCRISGIMACELSHGEHAALAGGDHTRVFVDNLHNRVKTMGKGCVF
jgi:hypothetical protein